MSCLNRLGRHDEKAPFGRRENDLICSNRWLYTRTILESQRTHTLLPMYSSGTL